MIAIILSAGRSQRFAAEGCTIPKHLLPMPDGRKLIEWQEERMFAVADNVSTIVLRDNTRETKKYLHGKLYDIKKSNGPLDTFSQVFFLLVTPQPILIIYNDAIISKEEYFYFVENASKHAAAQIIFESHADRYQYISDNWADGGVYYFRSGHYALSMLGKQPRPYTQKHGLTLLVKNSDDKTYIVSHTHTDLGIPRDYKNWMAKNGCPVTEW